MPYTPPEFEDHSPAKEVTAAKLTTMAQAIGNPEAATIATKPTPGANGTVTPGVAGLSRIRNFVLVGETGATKAKYTLQHNLETFFPSCTVYKELAANEYEQTLVKTIKVLTANEVEIEFAAAPLAGVKYWVQIDG